MNNEYYQPGISRGMMPSGMMPGTMMPGGMPPTMPNFSPQMPQGMMPPQVAGATPLDQMNHRLTKLEQQVRRLEARVTRLETPFPESQAPGSSAQPFDLPESTFPSPMHMM